MSLVCEFCGKRFRNNEELRKHLNKKHRDKVKLAILEHPVGKSDKEPMS